MGYIIKDSNEIKKIIAFNEYPDEITVINNEEIEFDFQIIKDFNKDIFKEDYYSFISESGESDGYFLLENDVNNHFVQENHLTIEQLTSFSQKILVVADYGDGIIEYHSKPLELFDDLSEKWSTFAHKFNFKKDYFISNNESRKERKMTFTVYTKIGSHKEYNISYTVIDPSEITNDDAYKKVKFRLLSANLDNNGKISLMLDNIAGEKSKIVLAEIKKP